MRIFWLPGAFFLLNEFFNRAVNLYEHFPWVDIPMHTVGGVIIAYSMEVFFDICRQKKYIGKLHPALHVLFLTALVGTIAVLWEFHEFIRDTFFREHTQPSVPDTMLDLFLGLLGGFITSSILVLQKKRNFFWDRVFLR